MDIMSVFFTSACRTLRCLATSKIVCVAVQVAMVATPHPGYYGTF